MSDFMTEEWNKDYPKGLSGLLYPLFHVENARRDPILPPVAIESYKVLENREKLKEECELLNWALKNKDYDYKTILNFHQSNDDIVCFIQKLADLYDREKLFDLFEIECAYKQTKTDLEEQYFQDNYVNTPRRLSHLRPLFSGIVQYEFSKDKPLPPKFLDRYLNRWGASGYSDIRTQINWCKEHPKFDYAEFLSLKMSNSELLDRFNEIDDFLMGLESGQ
jgi:hypothetical protein